MYAQFGGNEEVSRQISYLKLRKAASKEELRRITMDAVGTFAEAVGKDRAGNHGARASASQANARVRAFRGGRCADDGRGRRRR